MLEWNVDLLFLFLVFDLKVKPQVTQNPIFFIDICLCFPHVFKMFICLQWTTNFVSEPFSNYIISFSTEFDFCNTSYFLVKVFWTFFFVQLKKFSACFTLRKSYLSSFLYLTLLFSLFRHFHVCCSMNSEIKFPTYFISKIFLFRSVLWIGQANMNVLVWPFLNLSASFFSVLFHFHDAGTYSYQQLV